MKSVFILIFILFGLLQFGILLSAWSAQKSKYKPTAFKYWGIALSLSATSYLCFAIALTTSEELLNKNNFIMTIANTLIFAGVFFQGFFVRALRTAITPKLLKVFLGLILLFALQFEVLRGHISFEGRTISVGLMLFAVYLWQILEIVWTKRALKSFQLKMLLGLVVAEALFIVLRVVVIYQANTHVHVLGEIPPIASGLLWLQLTLNILSYVSMIGYWHEEIREAHVVSEYENVKMKALLEEKDQLLKGLVKARKLAELGAMTASIAHEINQPLGAIKLDAWSLKQTDKTDNNLTKLQKELVASITKGADQVAEIIKTIRGVFRSEVYLASEFDIAKLIGSLNPVIEAEVDAKNAQIVYKLPANLMIKFNANELSLVVLNLLSNALRAGAQHVLVEAGHTQDGIFLSIADDGEGVSADIVGQLFEISKDSQSDGLGLGLWLSKYVLERGAAEIDYQANLPKGSIFKILFK